MIEKLIPLLIAGGIAAHGKDAIKDRFANMMSAPTRIATKQRMNTIFYTVQLMAVDDDPAAQIKNQKQFVDFAKARVRIKGQPGADPSLDAWGVQMRYEPAKRGFTIASAGPDKKHGTADDEKMTQDPFDY